MAKRQVTFTFPQELIREPIIYNLGQQYKVVTNIHQADISANMGWMVLGAWVLTTKMRFRWQYICQKADKHTRWWCLQSPTGHIYAKNGVVTQAPRSSR